MASNYTEHYDLCQWEATDAVQRVEFNADNAKVDAALDALAGQVAEKADGDDLAALSETVAEVSAGMGNCQMELFTYTGTGTCGAGYPTMVQFSHLPELFFIGGSESLMLGRGGVNQVMLIARNLFSETFISEEEHSWSGNHLSLVHSENERYQMNLQGVVYWVVGLYRKK